MSSASIYGLINLPGKHSLFICLSVEIPPNVISDHKPETSNFYVSAAGSFSCGYKCHGFWNLMPQPPLLETGVLFPWQGECPSVPVEQIQLICFLRHFVVTRLEMARCLVCRCTLLRCRKFLCCFLRDACCSWNLDYSLGRRLRKLVLCYRLPHVLPSQRGNALLSLDTYTAIHRYLI